MTYKAKADRHLYTLYTDHSSGVVTFNDFCTNYYHRFEVEYYSTYSVDISGKRGVYPWGTPYYPQWRLNKVFLSWLLGSHPIPVKTPTHVVGEPKVFKMVRTSSTSPVPCIAT